METLEQLRRRLEVGKDLEAVVGTMKIMAAVGVREYEAVVRSLRDSARVIQQGFQFLYHAHPELVPTGSAPAPDAVVHLVVGSDQGLCGPFNRSIVDHALQQAGRNPLAAVGHRAARELELSGRSPEVVFPLPGTVDATAGGVRRVLAWLEERPGEERVMVHHNRPTGRAGYEPRTTVMSPLDRDLLRAIARRPLPGRCLPMPLGDPVALEGGLRREATSLVLYRAMGEGRAAEHTARLAAMQQASQSISDRMEELTRRYHRSRQAAITEELLDVVSGFEALTSDGT